MKWCGKTRGRLARLGVVECLECSKLVLVSYRQLARLRNPFLCVRCWQRWADRQRRRQLL